MQSLLPRSHYPALETTAYLNQASLGMMGQPTVDALQTFVETVGRHGNLYMTDDDEVGYYENLRQQGANILGSNPDQVAILSGASELFGQLPFLLPAGPDQTVLLLSSDFPAITRPWLRLQQMGGCTIQFVDDDPDKDLTELLCASLTDQTAVLAISYVQYDTGTRIDPVKLRQATNAVGAKLVLDVTQAAGALQISADAWQADVVISSGYKWLGGHGGAALAVLAPDLLNQPPPLPGWMGAPDPFDFDATRLALAPDARRFTQSTMSYGSLAALTAGIEQLLKIGLNRIEEHAKTLATELTEKLSGSDWLPFRPIDDPCAAPHIVSLAAKGQDAAQIVKKLHANGVVCSSRGGRIRVSLAPYNNSADIERLVNGLHALNVST